MDIDAEKPKIASLYYVVLASLLMFLLQVFPWPQGFMAEFFNGFDTMVYEHHGSWVVTGRVPYVEIPIPYPPLDVVMNGLPHLLPFGYRDSFILVNFLIFWGLTYAYWQSVRRGLLVVSSASVVLLGLPSVLYNVATFNDLRPAGAVMLALILLRSGRPESGIALLASSVFFKSYPLFLLPVAFCWVASQHMEPAAAASAVGRIRGYLAALVSSLGVRLVGVAVCIACLIGGAVTLWTGTRWLTAPTPNYAHLNPENLAYLLATYTPLGWTGGIWFARALAAATLLGAFALVPLRRFDNAVRVGIVVVIAVSMSVSFHSPHWNLWFMFLFCLIPISRPLLLVLVVYDINNLLFWPLFSLSTPIEVLQPLAREVWIYLIVAECALKFVLIGWLLKDAWQRRGR